MILGEQLTLYLEQTFRITQVTHQIAGDFGKLMVLAGEDLFPCLDDRIGFVPHIQIHRTVIGVDGGLHRITDIVGVLRIQTRDSGRSLRGGVLGRISQIGHL